MKTLAKKIGAVALAVAMFTSSSMASERGMNTGASNFAQPQAKVMAFDGIPSHTIANSELADTNGENALVIAGAGIVVGIVGAFVLGKLWGEIHK